MKKETLKQKSIRELKEEKTEMLKRQLKDMRLLIRQIPNTSNSLTDTIEIIEFSLDNYNFTKGFSIAKLTNDLFYNSWNAKKYGIKINGGGFSKTHDVYLNLKQFIEEHNIENCAVEYE